MIPTLYKWRHGARSSRKETWSKLFCRSVKVVDFIFLGTITFNYDYILYIVKRVEHHNEYKYCNLFLDDYDNKRWSKSFHKFQIITTNNHCPNIWRWVHLSLVISNNYIMFINKVYHESVSRIKMCLWSILWWLISF